MSLKRLAALSKPKPNSPQQHSPAFGLEAGPRRFDRRFRLVDRFIIRLVESRGYRKTNTNRKPLRQAVLGFDRAAHRLDIASGDR